MIIFLIFLSFWLGIALSSAYIALGITAIVFLLFVYKRFNKYALIVCSFTLIIGFSFSFLKVSSKTHQNTFHGLVYDAKDNYFLFNSGGERLYVYSKDHSYDIGDFLTISGEKEDFSFTRLESSFDFEGYLHKRGVFHSLKVKKIKVEFHNFIRIHERRNKLLSQFNEDEASLIGAILFSDGGDGEINSALKELHLARFLSASGIFISAFYFALRKLLSLFLQDKYAEITSISLLVLYSVFTFPRFSVIKVLLLLIIRWINKNLLNSKFSYLTIISGFGIFCLLCNHFLAIQDSFILGFSIPLISYLSRYFYKKKGIRPKLERYLTIYLFFLPFEVAYYNKIVILSLPLQVILTPLFILIAFISLLCFFYVPLYPVVTFLVNILKGITGFLSPLSFGINMPAFNQALTVIYFVIYLLWLIYLSKGFVPIHRFLLTSMVGITILNALPIRNYFTNEVNFINVGQGDCTLIRNKNKVALIDTGGLTYMDVANDSLVPFLRKKRIYKIDTVFITHYDYDHYGALASLNKSYPIKQIVDYSSNFPVKVGDVTFNNYNYYASSEEENDKSLVLSFSVGKKDFVVMGDAPSYIEKEIIKHVDKIDCDILKVGHHGSNTSTCEEWLKYLNPKEAIISCGKNNKFGHPNKEVVSLLNKYKIKIRRTDLEGTIKYAL